jgi:hypothetical protein
MTDREEHTLLLVVRSAVLACPLTSAAYNSANLSHPKPLQFPYAILWLAT